MPRVKPILSAATLMVACFARLSNTLPTLDPEQVKVFSAVYDAYLAQNLSYDCFRYSDYNAIAECDCLACVAAQPDVVPRMCRFKEVQDALKDDTQADPNNLWKKICDGKCSAQLPAKCCDPSKGVHFDPKGCATCLPTRPSGSTVGQHASCFLAESDAAKKPSGLSWSDRYARLLSAMDGARLSRACISYALVRTANPCDCEPCLRSEKTANDLRRKLCEFGRRVRATKELLRPDFWGHNDYFLKFCDFEACPEMAARCCAPHDGSESREGRYPIDKHGCPACLPTSELFGFGPRCQRKFQRLPTDVQEKIYSRLSVPSFENDTPTRA